MKVDPDYERVATKMMANMLRLAVKAGKLKIGIRDVDEELKRKAKGLLLAAVDAPAKRLRFLVAKCTKNGGVVAFWKTKGELGEMLGYPEVSVVFITEPGFADKVYNILRELKVKTIKSVREARAWETKILKGSQPSALGR